jgi:hypothetical protein
VPIEIIGEFGTPGADWEWLGAEGKLAIRQSRKSAEILQLKWN